MSRNSYEPKRVRTVVNQITGEMERTILDKVQLAYEQAVRDVERPMLRMEIPEQRRYIEKVAARVLGMLPHSQDDYSSLLRELILALADRLAVCSELLGKCATRRGCERSPVQ